MAKLLRIKDRDPACPTTANRTRGVELACCQRFNHSPQRGLWLALFLVLVASLLSHSASFPLRWRWSNPTPHGGNIVDMAYSPSLTLAVQVCERGQIFTSDNLAFWIPRESGTTNDLRAVGFFQNRILVAGAEGRVLYADSPDTFQNGVLLDGPTSDWLEAVAVGPSLAVAVGDFGAIYTSTNGAHWKRQNSTVNDWLLGVAYGPSGFVAVGENGRVLTSPNGTNWTRRTSGTLTALQRVTYFDGQYTAVGSNSVSYNSANGIAWTAQPTGGTHPLWHASGNNNARMVVGERELRLGNLEGTTWVDQIALTNGPPDWTYYANISFNDYFMAAGRTGMLVEGFRTNSGPYFWLPPSDSVRHLLFDITYPGGLFVAVGDQATLLTSGNGIDWSLELPPLGTTSTTFLGVGGDTNLLVAAGDSGTLIVSPNGLTNITITNIVGTNIIITNQLVNTLGVVWHAIEPRPSSMDLQGVTVGHGLYLVTGGGGTVLTSPNGTNWTAHPTPTSQFLSGAASWPGGFVASGDQGTLLTSPDGTNWTALSTGTTNWLYRVRYVGDRLIALGQNGILLTSTDAQEWFPQNSGSSRLLQDVVHIDDSWFAVGIKGTVLASSNSVDWTSIGTITGKDLWAASTDGTQLIAGGSEGIILRSQIVPNTNAVTVVGFSRVQIGANYQSVFLLGGQPDQQFTLDHRNVFDTNQWITGPALEFFDSSGTLFYLETIPVGKAPPMEFYRSSLLLP